MEAIHYITQKHWREGYYRKPHEITQLNQLMFYVYVNQPKAAQRGRGFNTYSTHLHACYQLFCCLWTYKSQAEELLMTKQLESI